MTTGIIFDIKKFAIHDGPGIRTTVFFKGCPLECWWCHNPESRCAEAETMCVKVRRGASNGGMPTRDERFGYEATADRVMVEIEKDRVFYEESGGGVTFSGGEPMLQVAFLREMLTACRRADIHTAVDTSGYAAAADFEQVQPLIDLFLYDIKLMDDAAHRRYTGVSNRPILANLIRLAETGACVLPRIPLIPGITDTDENLLAIAEFLKAIPGIADVSLLPYNKLGEDKSDKFGLEFRTGSLAAQSLETLEAMSGIFAARGLRVNVEG